MKVYILQQKQGHGSFRIRGVYINKQDAIDFIGPRETWDESFVEKCQNCGQKQKPGPKFNSSDAWKKNLLITPYEVIE